MDKNIKILLVGEHQCEIDSWIAAIQPEDLSFTFSGTTSKSGFRDGLITFFPEVIICGFSVLCPDIHEVMSIRNEISPFVPLIAIVDREEELRIADILSQGSDDYVLKTNLMRLPFAVRTSISRLNSLLFRLKAEEELRGGEPGLGIIENSLFDKSTGGNPVLMDEYRSSELEAVKLLEKGKQDIGQIFPEFRKQIDETTLVGAKMLWGDDCINLVVKSMKIGFFSVMIADERISYDKQSINILGLDTLRPCGTKTEFFSLVHPDDREEIKTLFRFAIEREKDFEVEYRIFMRDGSLRHVASKARIIYDMGHKPIKLNGILWDITDQKLLEIYLRENLRKMNSIINNLNGAVFRCKVDEWMTMEYISEGINKITGYNSWDFLLNSVRSLFSIMVPKDMGEVRSQVNAALESGTLYTVEYRIKASNGESKWLSMRGHGVYAGKSLVAHEGFISDVTERKKVESRLNKSLKQLQQLNRYIQTVREKEQMAIARELHDDLGQSLTAVKIDLGTLKNKLNNKDEALERIDKLSLLVSNTIKTVQNITAHLRPQIIDDLGLISAIEWYSKDYSNRTGIKIFLKLTPVLDIPAESSLTVFRILQESLTNIARHSKATKAEIRLWIQEKSLFMDVKDNGTGISEHDRKSKRSFGLMSMVERANSLGGEIHFSNPEEGGAIVSLKMPYKEKTKYEDSYL